MPSLKDLRQSKGSDIEALKACISLYEKIEWEEQEGQFLVPNRGEPVSHIGRFELMRVSVNY